MIKSKKYVWRVLNYAQNRDFFIKHSKILQNNVNFKDVYLNKDMTKTEIEEERALKRLRKERNDIWEYWDGSC